MVMGSKAPLAWLLVAAAVAAELDHQGPEAVALSEDDQCLEEGCALQALQSRGKKLAAAASNAGVGSQSQPWSCRHVGCSSPYDRSRPCQCNSKCMHYGNCCGDYSALCSLPPPSACYKTGRDYSLSWKAQGSNFLDDWTFVTEDMVHGAQQFTTRAEAIEQGVVAVNASGTRLSVGGLRDPSRPDEAFKRYAPHIRTNRAWDPQQSFIVAMKYSRVPHGCGVWPGFWTVNSDNIWPAGGELDIMEYANYDESKVSFHISDHCKLDARKVDHCLPKGSKGSGPMDCYTSYFTGALGCRPRQHQRRGDQFTPGVIAAQWTPQEVIVYLFPEGQVPADLTSDAPKPDGWSDHVVAYLPFQAECQGVGPQEVVLNIQLCGDAAGGPWSRGSCAPHTAMQAMTGQCHAGLSEQMDCCTQFVTSPARGPELEESARFEVEYVKVFTPGGVAGTPSGTFLRGGALLH